MCCNLFSLDHVTLPGQNSAPSNPKQHASWSAGRHCPCLDIQFERIWLWAYMDRKWNIFLKKKLIAVWKRKVWVKFCGSSYFLINRLILGYQLFISISCYTWEKTLIKICVKFWYNELDRHTCSVSARCLSGSLQMFKLYPVSLKTLFTQGIQGKLQSAWFSTFPSCNLHFSDSVGFHFF